MKLIFGVIISAVFLLGCQSISKISITKLDFRTASIPPSRIILGEISMMIDLKEATFYPKDSTLTMHGILRDEATKVRLKDRYGYISICQDTTKDFCNRQIPLVISI